MSPTLKPLPLVPGGLSVGLPDPKYHWLPWTPEPPCRPVFPGSPLLPSSPLSPGGPCGPTAPPAGPGPRWGLYPPGPLVDQRDLLRPVLPATLVPRVTPPALDIPAGPALHAIPAGLSLLVSRLGPYLLPALGSPRRPLHSWWPLGRTGMAPRPATPVRPVTPIRS